MKLSAAWYGLFLSSVFRVIPDVFTRGIFGGETWRHQQIREDSYPFGIAREVVPSVEENGELSVCLLVFCEANLLGSYSSDQIRHRSSAEEERLFSIRKLAEEDTSIFRSYCVGFARKL